jgi:phosphonate transport system permease protein
MLIRIHGAVVENLKRRLNAAVGQKITLKPLLAKHHLKKPEPPKGAIMSTAETAYQLPETPIKTRMLRYSITLLGMVVLLYSFRALELNPLDLIRYRDNMTSYAKGFLSPDFTYWREILTQMFITLQIAIWGTLLAIVFSIPCGLMSASNIVPVYIYQPMRRIMDAARAINEMIFAMLFIAAVGLGPMAGILALFVHTTGTLSKLFSEAVEAIDPRPVEGIRATGANAIEDIIYGVIPQVLPLWISYSLYRFEANVRSASVVGMVGAGGIGMLLWDAIRGFQYGATATMLLVIIVTVSLVDLLSAMVRKLYI